MSQIKREKGSFAFTLLYSDSSSSTPTLLLELSLSLSPSLHLLLDYETLKVRGAKQEDAKGVRIRTHKYIGIYVREIARRAVTDSFWHKC